MYFRRASSNIVTRPLYYKKLLLKNSKPPEIDVSRNVLIFPSQKQLLPLSSNPRNLRPSTKTTDPLAPYSLSDKIISDFLVKNNLSEKSYLVHLGYISNGGILVIDPTNMKSVNEHKPYLNYSGLDVKKYERLMERRKFRREWYLKQGFSEEDIEKIEIVEDMEIEKKAARENRKIIRENLLKFLKPFCEENKQKLRVFVLDSKNSFEYKAVSSSLKRLGASDCLIHKNFRGGEIYSSMDGLKKGIEHFLYQLGIEENVKLVEYFRDIDMEFNWPPEFDIESNSYTVFLNNILEGKGNNLFGKIVTDRLRYKEFLEKYNKFLSKIGLGEEEIKKRIETLPSYEPIETLALRQHEKIGELRPFTEKIENLNEGKNILNSFSASQFSAPCTLSRIFQMLGVKTREKEEEERIFLGNEYHKLVLSNTKENFYINNEIWKLAGLKPIQRASYTERYVSGKIEVERKISYLSGVVDAIFICDGEMVLFEYKLSPVLPEMYKRGHAKQLLAYKRILESIGYKVADVGVLLYGIAPPPKPELRSSVTNRYVIFSPELKEEAEEDLKEYFKWIRMVFHSPEENIKKLREEEIKKGCKICSNDKLAELKDKEATEAMKRIKQGL